MTDEFTREYMSVPPPPMAMTEKQKERIDSMDFETMLGLWRFAKDGDPMFQGGTGIYFKEEMGRKDHALPPGEHARISKKIAWR